MAHGGHHPVMTHFNRFGTLAFRLAMAMLADEGAAADAVLGAFTELVDEGPDQLRWHTTLEVVRRRCSAMRTDRAIDAHSWRGPTAPAGDPPAEADEEQGHVSPPATSVHAAMAVLSETDRDILWSALVGRQGDTPDWEPLSEALRRLEIAINNQDIPGDGAEPWLE